MRLAETRSNALAERSISLWMATASIPAGRRLASAAKAEVVIIGSGIAGLSTAYELSKVGVDVAVIDRGAIGGGMTSRTSAHLTWNIDDLYQELIKFRGLGEARSYFRARMAAIDRIEEIQETEGMRCDFKRLDGFLFPARSGDVETLRRELDACRKVGARGVKWIDQTPIRDAGVGRSLVFPNNARFHPRKYLAGLVRAIKQAGGRLYAWTPVVNVDEDADGVIVRTPDGPTVKARAAVIATNAPINDRLIVHNKQAPYRTYVIAGQVPKGSVPDALYWDTLDPYHFVRIQPAGARSDWLLLGGEDHRTGEAGDWKVRLAKLEAWGRSLVPALGGIEYRWSGQVLDTIDYLPFIGKNPGNERIFVHTGDSGEGLTNGIIGSVVLGDLIRGRKNRRATMFSPGRVTARATGRFIRENVGVAVNLAGHLAPSDISSARELKRETGAVIRKGGTKVAAYRNRTGRLHLRSATCTHSGCLLTWNGFERCWDCPCHGSHFSIDGEPLNAPAVIPLAKHDA